VFVKIDTGYHRHGVDPRADRSKCLELVLLLSESHKKGLITFTGIYSHSGHAYGGNTEEETAKVAKEEVAVMNEVVQAIEAAGDVVPKFVSIGSTPACTHLPPDLGRVNEIHPGNYVFWDTQQFDLRSCELKDIACYVLARVTSHYPLNNTMTVDCGALALSKDKGSTHLGLPDRGYGTLKDNPDLYVANVSQEAGIIHSHGKGIEYDKYPIGSIVRIYPNHSCLTSACYSQYYVVDDSDEIISIWKNCREW